MEIKKGIILVSGGMDSTTLMYLFVHQKVEFIPLFIDYGQHCAKKEYATLLSVIPDSYRDKIEVINVSSYINTRNLALLFLLICGRII